MIYRNSNLFLLFFFLSTLLSAQTTYYVSENGSNSNNGLTPQNAFETLQFAADLVSAGDSVLALNGNYSGFDLRTSGTQNFPIVFKAIENDVVIYQQNSVTPDGVNIENADWIVIDGFKVIDQPRAGIRIALSDFIVIKNNHCTNNYRWGIFTGFTDDILIENNTCSFSEDEHGIYVSNSGDRPIVRNNHCFENNKCGIQLNADLSQGGDGIISDAIIESNLLHDNGDGGGAAVNLDAVQDSEIYNNLLYNNHATGIALFKIDGAEGSKNNKVYNNTIVNPTVTRWNILMNNGSTGNTLYNNILINHHSFCGSISIDASSVSGFQSDYNILENRLSNDDGNSNMTLSQWQALGYDLNSQLADPEDQIFADHLNHDYHLLQNSQAVNLGTSFVSSIVTEDFDDVSRPQGSGYDIGCYEFTSATGVSFESIPKGFELFQNYPNPFNPSTKIKFTIPISPPLGGDGRGGLVTLKVYDNLGNEVATLVSEELPAGEYEVNFDATDLTTGVYFYQLKSLSFTETKKMIVLK
jgi:parallel beta-helix repeat protein